MRKKPSLGKKAKSTLHSYLPKETKWKLHLKFQRKIIEQEFNCEKTTLKFFQKYHLCIKNTGLE